MQTVSSKLFRRKVLAELYCHLVVTNVSRSNSHVEIFKLKNLDTSEVMFLVAAL